MLANTPHPFRPVRALRAVAALARDPEDTAQVFTIIDALSGAAPLRMVRRFEQDPVGRRLLAERPNIVPVLSDRDALRRLPEGSLAHAYLRFVESEGITAEGLLAASAQGGLLHRDLPVELKFLHDRMRDTHDLWHAAVGYQGDVLGEAALLAFSVPQTLNPGIALITAVGLHRAESSEARQVVLDGFRRGLRAAWLPAQDWEALLPLPLDAVRARLKLDPPRVYTPVRMAPASRPAVH